VLGQSTTDLIAFHAGTPTSQRASATLSATLSNFVHTGASLATAATFSTSYAALVDAVTEIRTLLVAYGLHKGGA
jgi:hypothetical protein